MTRGELDARANQLGHDLLARGAGVGDFVTIALPNSVDWFVAYVACWKIGAIPQQVSSRLPRRELAEIVALAQPKVVLGAEPGTLDTSADCLPVGYRPSADVTTGPLPDAVSPAWKAPSSGGSTGRPKLIVTSDPSLIDVEPASRFGNRPGGCLVMPGPLYHNGPAMWSCDALLQGGHVVTMARFDAEGTLAAVAEHRADVLYLVPTMMRRILHLDDATRLGYDLSSLRLVWHLAEPCPIWLKQAWIDWLGAERIIELYAGTEAQAVTIITGPEWLEHPGSVGRPSGGEFMVTDDDGNPLPAGEQGEIWMRPSDGLPTYRYVGAESRQLGDGWESLGDVGWFDADGYLFLGDRKLDMILVGGANIYPAEVEGALGEHPGVRSVAVIGLPDDDKGNRIHAIVQADPAAVTADDLRTFLADRLTSYKIPRTWEFVETPLRDDAGKVRRSALRADRLPTT
ncbi:MAG TPA: AMP-binding protein [Ilumatobacter sp.]|nr:AMP-binding protein [Ilumatobacter sp.]